MKYKLEDIVEFTVSYNPRRGFRIGKVINVRGDNQYIVRCLEMGTRFICWDEPGMYQILGLSKNHLILKRLGYEI